MAVGCGSEYFHAQALCEVSTKLDEISQQALLLKDDALAAIADINSAYESLVNNLPAGYSHGTSPIGEYSAPAVPSEPDFTGDEPTPPDLAALDYSGFRPVEGTRPDYSGLEPTPVTIPDATDVVIGDTEWQRINDQAAADLALIGVGEELAAASEASWRGAAVPAVVSSLWASEAAQRTMDRISAGRLVSVVEQAKAAREDIKDVTQLDLNRYRDESTWVTGYLNAETQALSILVNKFQAETGWVQVYKAAEASRIQAEVALYQARVGWYAAYTQATANLVNARVELFKGILSGEKIKAEINEIEVKRLLEIADKTAGYALERAKIVQDRGIQVAERVAVLMAGVAQAFLSASSYSLHGQGSASVVTSIDETAGG